MDELLEQSARLVAHTNMRFHRYLHQRIRWDDRLIGIKGARGVGKTTLLLQRLKAMGLPPFKAAYLALDDIGFTMRSLRETADAFYKRGGRFLAIDEVHKYPRWAVELKNLHDFYPELQIVFTGSSILDISRESGDLSRRALLYELDGLSYREYLAMKDIVQWPVLKLAEILHDPATYVPLLSQGIRPLEHFQAYLEHGYYPFGVQQPDSFSIRIRQIVRAIVETDMAEIPSFDIRNARKMLQLIEVIAGSVPFKPNLVELAEKTGIHRNSLTGYLHHLEQAKIISLLSPAGRSTAMLQKPEKILMQNPSLHHALSRTTNAQGSIRESFVHAMLSHGHHISAPTKGDFLVDDEILLEVGGPSKKSRHVRNLDKAWVVKDGIELGSVNSLPIWVLGLLY